MGTLGESQSQGSNRPWYQQPLEMVRRLSSAPSSSALESLSLSVVSSFLLRQRTVELWKLSRDVSGELSRMTENGICLLVPRPAGRSRSRMLQRDVVCAVSSNETSGGKVSVRLERLATRPGLTVVGQTVRACHSVFRQIQSVLEADHELNQPGWAEEHTCWCRNPTRNLRISAAGLVFEVLQSLLLRSCWTSVASW